jgi:signal transduction histidine kinase
VADSGPGISLADQEHLFSLFFTKRMRGRGVGLYLCRTNLARGKHQISYAINEDDKCLSGANFLIEFEGVENV